MSFCAPPPMPSHIPKWRGTYVPLVPNSSAATGKGPCFRGHPHVHRKGAGPSAPQFW